MTGGNSIEVNLCLIHDVWAGAVKTHLEMELLPSILERVNILP